jgi:hypothetical protein
MRPRTRGADEWGGQAADCVRAAILALGVLWFAAAGWAYLNGPRLRAEAEQRTAEEAEAESRTVCGRLGMAFGTERYSPCASELNWVRRQEQERREREAGGAL